MIKENFMDLLNEERNLIEFSIKQKAKRWLRHFDMKYPGYDLKSLKPYIHHGSFGVIINYQKVLGKNWNDITDGERESIIRIACHYAWIKYFFGVE